MKQFFVIKVSKGEEKYVEKVLLNCLVDRLNLCSIIKLIELNSDSKYLYFVLGGEKFSCKRVLLIAKKILTEKNIDIKIGDYNSVRTSSFDDLVWLCNSNEIGKSIKSYYNNPIFYSYMKKLTTKFVLKRGLLSNHVFCPECDGFADIVELTSLKGVYKCSFCDADVVVEGPLLTGKKPVNHLSTEEQLYLIGKPNEDVIKLSLPEKNIKPKQMSLVSSNVEVLNKQTKARKRKRKLFYSSSMTCINNFEQLTWNIIF